MILTCQQQATFIQVQVMYSLKKRIFVMLFKKLIEYARGVFIHIMIYDFGQYFSGLLQEKGFYKVLPQQVKLLDDT